MTEKLSSLRRSLVALTGLAFTLTVTAAKNTPAAEDDAAVHPFHYHASDSALADLRKRIANTRWPDKETVSDRSQGTQLATIREIIRYWGTDYDWRKVEGRLDALPMFSTKIDGVDIQFIQVKSRNPNALPIIITHGWPGSTIELLGVIDPLTNPTAHGGRAEDAFDVVIPSMPGYGFSGKPTSTGWDPDHIARAWVELMKRLGYTRYVAQGGDWGSPVTEAMARQAPAGYLPATIPPEVGAAIGSGAPAPAGFSDKERAAFDTLVAFNRKNRAYSVIMETRPQMIGYALTDSPVGLAAFIYDYNNGEPERFLTKDQVLDDITLYWLTNTAASSARLYWENQGRSPLSAGAQMTGEISLPVALTVFPDELYLPRQIPPNEVQDELVCLFVQASALEPKKQNLLTAPENV